MTFLCLKDETTGNCTSVEGVNNVSLVEILNSTGEDSIFLHSITIELLNGNNKQVSKYSRMAAGRKPL